ncbi:unnamed protein product [Cylicocyclus nassatus]|uniref:Uncharacterized protein n=1 Tax=Cylicocyclus nassatus TaxID=53992 RepID=A0AA36DJR1_CYLNA|nr:unnamed protein product [Cylicocyclus nassatus]
MSLELVIYILYVFANTLIVLLNVLVIWAAVKSRELMRNFTLHIVITAIILDIAVYMIIIFHDVPSFASNEDFTTPLFTKYCGFTYLIPGHYWYFDFAKPYTYLYQHFNEILQITCGVFVLVSDMCIICRILRVRSLSLRKHCKSGAEKKWKVGREGRIAINFLLMSSCFLVMSVFYNVNLGYGFWQTLLLKISTLLNLSKWAIYVLAYTSISKVIKEMLGFQTSQHNPPTTTTVTKF